MLNKIVKVLCFGSMLFGVAGVMAAAEMNQEEEAKLYIGVHGGINLSHNWSSQVNLGSGVSAPGSIKTTSGPHLGIMIGRQSEHARFELEYQQGQAKVSQVRLGGSARAGSGHVSYEALTLNAYRREALSDDKAWQGFLGAGIGWGKSKSPAQVDINGCPCFDKSVQGSGLLYQLRAGVEREISKASFIHLQYTHLFLPALKAQLGADFGRNNIGAISIGYRKVFD